MIAELPPRIAAVGRPTGSGALRAVLGALPDFSCDIFHGLDVDIPLATRAATVSTVHDLSVLDMPEASSRFRAAGEALLVRNALRRADLLIAVSAFTADRIRSVSGRDAVVVELAPAAWTRTAGDDEIAAVRAKYDLPDQFIMQVGTVEPRKNVHLLAAAAEKVGLRCVLAGAGSTGPRAPRGVQGLGYVDLDDLPALYGAATVTGYASRYEGFGLPPVEAMACGGAVVASAVGALPDVVGDGAILVGTEDVDDWAAAIRPLIDDPARRAELTGKARAAAAELTWSRTAAGTVDAYRTGGLTW